MTSFSDNNAPSNNAKRRGRPRVEQKQRFVNVAIPADVHGKIKDLAFMENRTIARQLKTLIEQAHTAKACGRIFN